MNIAWICSFALQVPPAPGEAESGLEDTSYNDSSSLRQTALALCEHCERVCLVAVGVWTDFPE